MSFRKILTNVPLAVLLTLGSVSLNNANAQGNISVGSVKADLSNPNGNENYWKNVKSFPVMLMAQPMANPKPEKTETSMINVQAVHNGKWAAFRLTWKDTEKSEAGPLGKFSDGVAIEFPVKVSNGVPPSAFMGEKGNPVHIYHWKSAFQYDKDNGKMKIVQDIYPNMSSDMNSPVEPKEETREHQKDVKENYPKATDAQKEVFSHGKAAGNAQSYPKLRAMDEIYAEGWGTSQVIDNHESIGNGKWEKGQWSVVISRPLKSKVGSSLEIGKNSFVCFAVWQGGKNETGSRKAVTLSWIPLNISGK